MEIDKKTAQEYIDKLINTKTYNILDNLKEEIFNNNKDKLPHLTFTYINESDTYYLIDVK